MTLLKKSALISISTLFNISVFAQHYNKKLVAQLDTILKTDQQYRGERNASPKQDKLNMRRQEAIDMINLAKVDKIIGRYGYPGRSMVGAKHQSTVFLVIQHSDTETQEKYLPLLTAATEKGELKASSLGILTDRIRTANGQPQIYGSQLHETKDGIKIYPIEDERNVNIRRAKIGLQPLEIYYKHWKINYKVPTDSYANPAGMYYIQKERPESPVEAVGGDKAIFEKLIYPKMAEANHITGFVTVQLTIDKDGNTKNITVVKSLGYGCNEEALRVMKDTKYNNKTSEEHEIRMNLPFPYKN